MYFYLDKCLDWAFIPCLGKPNKLFKSTDGLYYPHDMKVADLFTDILSIIELPGIVQMTNVRLHEQILR